MPKIYGNLQPQQRKVSLSGVRVFLKRSIPYLIGVAVIYLLVVSAAFKVKRVEVRGVSLLNPSDIQALVPTGGSIWLFPKNAVANDILKNPTVSQVRILRGLPDSIRVDITEREARAFWVTGTKGSVLDNQGEVFEQYELSNMPDPESLPGKTIASIPHIIDESGLGAESGQKVASTLFLDFVRDTSQQLATYLSARKAVEYRVGVTTYDVTMALDNGLLVELNSLGDAGVQIRNLARLDRDGKLVGAQVVDLRIDRWAYVH
jgi:cell division septal protein FtsQ